MNRLEDTNRDLRNVNQSRMQYIFLRNWEKSDRKDFEQAFDSIVRTSLLGYQPN